MYLLLCLPLSSSSSSSSSLPLPFLSPRLSLSFSTLVSPSLTPLCLLDAGQREPWGPPCWSLVCHQVSHTQQRRASPLWHKTGSGYQPAAWFIGANRSVSLYRKFHWKEAGNRRDAAGEGWRRAGLFVIVECNVRNDRRHMRCTHTHARTHTKRLTFIMWIMSYVLGGISWSGYSKRGFLCWGQLALWGEGADCIMCKPYRVWDWSIQPVVSPSCNWDAFLVFFMLYAVWSWAQQKRLLKTDC